MSSDGSTGDTPKRRRRRLRAALTLLRRRIIKACDMMASAGGFYDDVSRNLGPLIVEFADVLPGEARERLERVLTLTQEGRADLDTGCKICKGEVRAAIKDISSRMGIEGQIREALRPIEERVPEWMVTSPLTPLIAGAVIIVMGGGLAAGIAAASSGGGSSGGDGQGQSTIATSPTDAAPQDTPADSGSEPLPVACDLITLADAEAIVGQSMVQTDAAGCVYRSVDDPDGVQGCPRAEISVYRVAGTFVYETDPELESGLGDEAFWSGANSLLVRKGDVGFGVSAWLKEPPCGVDQAELQSWRDEWRELAEIALSHLP